MTINIDMSESTVTDEFDPKSWDMVGSMALSKQLITGKVLADMADTRDDIVVLTADLGRPTKVYSFKERHPARYFNFGIAEKNMVSAAAGLAAVGLKPYVAGYACFLGIFAPEQIRTDIAYTNLPVRMLGSNSGIAMGFYGTSHHATEDIGMLRSIAKLTLLAPIDAPSLKQAIEQTVDHPGPVYMRLGRGRGESVYDAPIDGWRVGGSHQFSEGADAVIFATGTLVEAAIQAANILKAEGIGLRVLDMYSLKPIDTAAILKAAADTRFLFSAEEHNIYGGLGSAVAEVLAEAGTNARLTRIGIRDEYSILGPPLHLYRHYGLDGEGVASTVRATLKG
jgi:transketolase